MVKFLKYKQFEKEMILLCIRWYSRYPLSYRHLVEMMDERGVNIAHTTIMRWVHKAGPLLDHLVRSFQTIRSGFWRIDETIVKVKGKQLFLYRAV